MAEKFDRSSCVRESETLNGAVKYFSANLESVQNEIELQEEIMVLENALASKKSNDKIAVLRSQVENVKATFQFIADHKIELRKRLKSPNVPKSIPIKYEQQEKFVTSCQKLPAVIDFLESVGNERKVNLHNFLNSQQVVSHMEKEVKFGKEYSSHGKYFLSSSEGFLKNINASMALLQGGVVNIKTNLCN